MTTTDTTVTDSPYEVAVTENPGTKPGYIGVVTSKNDSWLRQNTKVTATSGEALRLAQRLARELDANDQALAEIAAMIPTTRVPQFEAGNVGGWLSKALAVEGLSSRELTLVRVIQFLYNGCGGVTLADIMELGPMGQGLVFGTLRDRALA